MTKDSRPETAALQEPASIAEQPAAKDALLPTTVPVAKPVPAGKLVRVRFLKNHQRDETLYRAAHLEPLPGGKRQAVPADEARLPELDASWLIRSGIAEEVK